MNGNRGYIQTLEKEVNSILQDMSSVPLEELNGESHMARLDKKYLFSSTLLPDILKSCNNHYFALEVNQNRLLNYQSDYYDLPNLQMYLDHHNGKSNRYKIRFREYLDSGVRFLEIKHKNNKGITDKKRIQVDELDISAPSAKMFIETLTPYKAEDLSESLRTSYQRITLVNKQVDKRITIDCNIEFCLAGKKMGLPGVAIAEIKNLDRNPNSRFNQILDSFGISEGGFSKYAVGISLLHDEIKKNRFKEKLIKIQTYEDEFTEHYAAEYDQ